MPEPCEALGEGGVDSSPGPNPRGWQEDGDKGKLNHQSAPERFRGCARGQRDLLVLVINALLRSQLLA